LLGFGVFKAGDTSSSRMIEEFESFDEASRQPLWQAEQCFASMWSIVTSNMLLQPMQTRWIFTGGLSPGAVAAE
jgi:hypothetical protein